MCYMVMNKNEKISEHQHARRTGHRGSPCSLAMPMGTRGMALGRTPGRAWAWPATPRRFAREEKQAGADRATIDPPVYFSGTMSHDGRVSMGRRERTTFQVVYSWSTGALSQAGRATVHSLWSVLGYRGARRQYRKGGPFRSRSVRRFSGCGAAGQPPRGQPPSSEASKRAA